MVGLVMALNLASCASSGTLGGGPEDKRPPKLVGDKSSVPYLLHCTDRKFTFTFDEFVEVKDAIKQVLVSPPLVYIPKIKARGKVVEFAFNEKEVLKENTTYIIQFGEAIRDFRASNALQNFKYVFSTGGIIDSLVVKGKVIDETKGEGVDGISVLLFDDLRDSAIVQKKPFYFTKTNKKGEFTLENLRQDTFRLVAIKDENGNLQFDELTEAIGFDSKWVTWADSTTEVRQLVLSKSEVEPRFAGYKQRGYGSLGIKWHTDPKLKPEARLEPSPEHFESWMKGDSLILHYHYLSPPDSMELLTGGKTIKMAVPDTAVHAKGLKYQLEFGSQGIVPGDTLWIDWERPPLDIDENLIRLADSSETLRFTMVKKDAKKTGIFANMKPNHMYDLTLLPGAVRDYSGISHDTISQRFKTYAPEKLSKLTIDIQGLDSTKQYLVYLTKGNKILKSEKIQQQIRLILFFDKLKSDTYSLQLAEDINGNGRIDGANYWEQRLAEKVQSFPLEKLRESWTLETVIDIRQKPAATQNTPGLK